MANAVMRYVPITVLYVTATVILINYFLLKQFQFDNIPIIFQYLLYSFILYFIYGYTVSINAGLDQCNKSDKKRAAIDGLITAFNGFFVYIAINMFVFLRDPFFVLFGNTPKATSISEIFFISLNMVMITVNIYFNSAKRTCTVPIKEIEKNLKKLDKYLNKPFRRNRSVPIKVHG
jgi:hypothetical protein